MKSSSDLPEGVVHFVRGYDFNRGIHLDDLLASYLTTGFQATELARAIDVVNAMVSFF
ncbi:unnamed protein product [Protopolystoma xenopodis]|uniref:Deoxyhypusine synthase n=1 Tax=Protopolystoma xenopodis TaxID=117903 RepID=A0A3S5BKE3_9PLAT|nr:unnamed protein product [Protopolystoma xenopodis]